MTSFVSWNCFSLISRKLDRLLGLSCRAATFATLDEGIGTTAFHFGVGWLVAGVAPPDEEVEGMGLGRALMGEGGNGAWGDGVGRAPMGQASGALLLCSGGGFRLPLGFAATGGGCMEAATEPLGAMAAGALLGAGDLERGVLGDDGRSEGRVWGLGALVGVGPTGSFTGKAKKRNTWPSFGSILLGMICHCVPGGAAGRDASWPDHTSPRPSSAPGAAGARQIHLLFHHFGFVVNLGDDVSL